MRPVDYAEDRQADTVCIARVRLRGAYPGWQRDNGYRCAYSPWRTESSGTRRKSGFAVLECLFGSGEVERHPQFARNSNDTGRAFWIRSTGRGTPARTARID